MSVQVTEAPAMDARRLRAAMAYRRLRQVQLAQAADISTITLRKIWSGQRQPSRLVALAIVRGLAVLGVPLREVVVRGADDARTA
jgi:transcriptional regulator with XRE-family HTH domain